MGGKKEIEGKEEPGIALSSQRSCTGPHGGKTAVLGTSAAMLE